jgi:hypothetical protein
MKGSSLRCVEYNVVYTYENSLYNQYRQNIVAGFVTMVGRIVLFQQCAYIVASTPQNPARARMYEQPTDLFADPTPLLTKTLVLRQSSIMSAKSSRHLDRIDMLQQCTVLSTQSSELSHDAILCTEFLTIVATSS